MLRPIQNRFLNGIFCLNRLKIMTASRNGIITGYYEPVLNGSLTAGPSNIRFPIYGKPSSESLRTLSREKIANSPELLKQHIIAWTNSPYDLFFLHIQGSGLIRFKDGSYGSLAYAGNNDHDYTSIGKILIEQRCDAQR